MASAEVGSGALWKAGPTAAIRPQLVVHGSRFTFINENQGVWSCETLINQADPPVFSDASSFDGRDEGMREVCPCLSHFLTTFCLHELLFGSRNLFCVDSGPENPGELLKGEIQPLWLDGMYAYKGVKYSFFLCDQDFLILATGMGPPEYWLGWSGEDTRFAKYTECKPPRACRHSTAARCLFIPGNGRIYVCPELIVHYMNAHGYAPPAEFCDAVLACPPMRSQQYFKELLANGGRRL
jgi:hypothetical protein